MAKPPVIAKLVWSDALRFDATSGRITTVVDGDSTAAAVERAIALSRDRYCSVWHSLRQDIELSTSFDITP